MGTCPKCGTTIVYVNIADIQVNSIVGGNTWNGIKYFCPSCGCVLSVAIDPVALKNDLVDEILGALGKH